MISFDEAIYFLMTTERHEVFDDALNMETYQWVRDGKVVAYGRRDLVAGETVVSVIIDDRQQVFISSNADRLRILGVEASREAGKLYSEALDIVIPEGTQVLEETFGEVLDN